MRQFENFTAYTRYYLENSINESDRRYYNRVYRKEEVIHEKLYVLKDNEVILGCKNPNFTKENTVSLDVKKFNDDGSTNAVSFLIVGRAGTGKSVSASIIALDNMVERFHEKLFIYDPKNEFDKHKAPSYEHELARKNKVDKYLKSINLARKGYKIWSIAPEIAGKLVKADQRFSITFSDILEIYAFDKTESIKVLIELMGIQTRENLIDLIRELIESKRVKSFKELLDKSEKVAEKLNLMPTQNILRRKLKIALDVGLLSNDEGKGIDILPLMKEYDAVIYKGKLKLTGGDTESDLPYNAALKLVMLKIIIDCALYSQGSDAAVVRSKNGVCFMLDEIDVLCDENSDSSTRIFVTNILTKYRSYRVDFIGIGQEASRIYHELFSQSKVILTSQVTSSNGTMLKARHVDKELLDPSAGILGQLKLKCRTSLDTYVSEWCAIDQDNQITLYYPMPSLSNFQ